MSAVAMTNRISGASPRFEARMAGVLFVLSVMTAAIIEIFVRGRLNLAAGLIAVSGMVAVTLLFYDLLSPLSRSLSFVAAFFNLAGLAFEALRFQPQGVNIAVVFDGFYCILVGYLVFRSASVPRFLGVLMALGGLGWLTFLSSALANYLSPYNLAFGVLGEGLVCVWILVGEHSTLEGAGKRGMKARPDATTIAI
jgi:hypothetical protein